MTSFFFNITDRCYKTTPVLDSTDGHINRVDISNGMVFLEGNGIGKEQKIELDNLDRLVMIVMTKSAELTMDDNISGSRSILKSGKIGIYVSSRQKITMSLICDDGLDVFVLFIADFFLKRYLSGDKNRPIDYLYAKIQNDISLETISILPIDALSLYTIDKLLGISDKNKMQSLLAEHRVVEFVMHCFGLIDIFEDDITEEEIKLASRAKSVLLQNFTAPPTINELAHMCATNEFKLKKVFKKVYCTTLRTYVQKLRLSEANLLLRQEKITIGEVAKRVGYKHQGHFSRLFFETYGVYPKELLSSC